MRQFKHLNESVVWEVFITDFPNCVFYPYLEKIKEASFSDK